ncbi:Rhodanese-like domain-containing protein [Suillus placidus]|uniref:Rhodanese-like domain-containing protein n=1 Tax=Suillus placidus TaxID=48579 RepID=A0A9P7CZR7_9AGAM|nr:Rhodanese-like domain-containing protein [Suillus placidus]
MVQGIIGSELAKLIKSAKVPEKDYLIVDVRDEDWKGGNIKGSRNYPSQRFLLEVDDLVERTKDVPIMIFHCALSQERGPKAARIYEETCNALHDADHTVYVLQGGFVQFGPSYFKDDPELVENWREIIW